MQNNEWVRDKEDRIIVLEQTLTTANLGTFIADTMVECQEVVANGLIKNGTLIMVKKNT